MAIRHDITLSTTEPNNDIGLLKIRQADEQTQTLVVQLTATSQPKSYEGLQAFFCAKLGQSVGLGIIEQKLEQSEMTNPKTGQLEYTFRPEDWQQIGRQVGYFSFRKMKDDGHEYVEQFTTRDFYFNVTKNVFSDGIKEIHTNGAIHIWTIEDLIRLFNEYIASGKSDWEQFVEDNREILESVDPGGMVLSELIDSRGGYDVLGNRLDDMPTKEDLALIVGDDGIDVDGGIPEYEKPVLINALSKIDSDKFNIGFGTDYHYDTSSAYNPHDGEYTQDELVEMWNSGLRKSLNLTSLTTKLDAVVFGGDNVDQPSAGGREVMVKHQRDFANTVFSSSKSPAFLLKGNHDCNYNTDRFPETVILDEEIAKIYRQNDPLYGENRLNKSNYFYKDFDDKKVRLIGLDMYDMPEEVGDDGKIKFNRFTTSGLQQIQLDWLANEALLTIPSNYVVLIVGHCVPANTLYGGALNHNHIILQKILESFVSGTSITITDTGTEIPAIIECHFSTPGKLAGFLCGHYHLDDAKTVNGVNYASTRCSLVAGDEMDKTDRMSWFGTPNEDAFDIVTLDVTNSTLTLNRVGAGSGNSEIATRTLSF